MNDIPGRLQVWLHTSVGTPEADIPAASGYDITPVIVSVAVGVLAVIGITLFSRWAQARSRSSGEDAAHPTNDGLSDLK